MASSRMTPLSPARRAIVDAFTKISSDEQSALRTLAARARMDIWDFLAAKKWAAGTSFSATPRRRALGLAPEMEAAAGRSLADRARFEADGTAKANALGEELRRKRRSA